MSWMRDEDNDTGSVSALHSLVAAGFRRLNERLDKIEADMTTVIKEQVRKDIIETLEAYDEHMCGPDLYSAIQHLKDQIEADQARVPSREDVAKTICADRTGGVCVCELHGHPPCYCHLSAADAVLALFAKQEQK